MWLALGDPWPLNPALTLDAAWFDVVRLWRICRGGMGGTTLLPDPGAVNDQSAWLMDAMSMLSRIEAEADKAEREAGGR